MFTRSLVHQFTSSPFSLAKLPRMSLRFLLLLPSLLLALVTPPAIAQPRVRELNPQERNGLLAALQDGAGPLALDTATLQVFARRAGSGWSYSGWVDSRPDFSNPSICKQRRYTLQRTAGASRWRLDPNYQSYWAPLRDGSCLTPNIHVLGEMDDSLFLRMATRAGELLKRADLVIRGNTTCARETTAGLALYEISGQLDLRGRGLAQLSYVPASATQARHDFRWSLRLRFDVDGADITPAAANCEELGH